MYLEIVNVGEIKFSEKAQKNYRTIGVRENVISKMTKPDGTTGYAKGVAKTGIINAWEDRWDNGHNDLGYDEEVGEFLMGSIVRRKVLPYTIPGNDFPVESYKAVVLGDVNDPSFELEVERVFKAAGHELIESTVSV